MAVLYALARKEKATSDGTIEFVSHISFYFFLYVILVGIVVVSCNIVYMYVGIYIKIMHTYISIHYSIRKEMQKVVWLK